MDETEKKQYITDLSAHDDAIANFDAYEAMHGAKTYDQESKQTKNGITDSKTAVIYGERAARVAGQPPEGEVQALGKRDTGKAMLADILIFKWVFPNAYAQWDLETKGYLWQYGKSMYGGMPMYYDLNVSPQGYFGPDCWLWNPRNFIPQAGQNSVCSMDYCHAIAYKTPQWFEDILSDEDSNYDKGAIRSCLEQIKTAKKQPDPDRDTKTVRDERNQPVNQTAVATRYEAGDKGRWVTFLPDFGHKVIREIENPHKNGKIPFVILPTPDVSSYYGISDFQRSMPMQFTNDAIDNFYFMAIKRNLWPRTAINAQTIVPHTLSPEPGAIVEFNGPPDWKQEDTSTAGLSTYQAAKGMAQGAIQSIAGTTDTVQNAETSTDPSFGKTPEALQMIQARESTRDQMDRKLLERAWAELVEGWLSLLPLIAEKIPVDLYAEEVAEIAKTHPDVLGIFKHGKPMMDEDGKEVMDEQGEPMEYSSPLIKSGLVKATESNSKQQVRLVIDPQKLKGVDYKFQLTPNSTAKKTKEEQLKDFIEFIGFLGKMPNALEQLQAQTGLTLDIKRIGEIYSTLSDVPGMESIFTQAAAPEQPKTESPKTEQGGNIPMTPESVSALANAPAPSQPQSDEGRGLQFLESLQPGVTNG